MSTTDTKETRDAEAAATLVPGSLHNGLMRPAVVASIVLAALLLAPGMPAAQQKPLHLNPVIAKLAEGKTVYGLNTGDLSLAYAREVARAPVDFIYADLEHNPLDFPALHMFLMGMTDKATILKKGNLQPNVALFARFPPEADQSQWVVKQALDIGLHGVIFNGVDRKEQALIRGQEHAVPAAERLENLRAGGHPRGRSGKRHLALGDRRGGVRTPRRPVAAQS